MGLVEVHGKATGEETVTSPVSEQPCYFYKVAIEKGHTGLRGDVSWVPYATDTDGVGFYLKDDTGKVLVDAHGVELNVPESGQKMIGHGTILLRDGSGREVEVTTSGEIVTKSGLGAGLSKMFGKKDAPPPAPLDPWFHQWCEEMRAKEERLRDYVARAASYGRSGSSGAPTSHTDKYLLFEYCILPEFEYELTGTCAENPKPQGEHDLKMIVKGENDPTFSISLGNEESVEGDLRHRAKLYVFGGACLSVVSMGIILWIFS